MRTTLTLDDTLANALKQLAHESGKPFKQVVNETLLAGLYERRNHLQKAYRLRPTTLGVCNANVNLDKALHLANELEDQALIEKMGLLK